MIKKLLLLFFISFSLLSFSQDNSIRNLHAHPNPFSENTVIKFTSTVNQNAFITIKNILGKTVYRGFTSAKKGQNSFPFEKGDLKSGIYIYAVQGNKDFISKRFVIK